MNRIWLVIRRTVFWSYDRGTWQYDVLVVAIVLFVFLSPRSWYHDEPQAVEQSASAGVQFLREDLDLGTKTYRVDVAAVGGLEVKQRTPELERKAHDVLRNSVPELKARNFRIERIETVLSDNGSVLYYSVRVK